MVRTVGHVAPIASCEKQSMRHCARLPFERVDGLQSLRAITFPSLGGVGPEFSLVLVARALPPRLRGITRLQVRALRIAVVRDAVVGREAVNACVDVVPARYAACVSRQPKIRYLESEFFFGTSFGCVDKSRILDPKTRMPNCGNARGIGTK